MGRQKAGIVSLHAEPRGDPAQTQDKVRAILASLEDMKAEDIVEIDLRGKSSLADVMIIATGRVARHVGAIADRIARDLKEKRQGTTKIEGLPACDWVLIDAGDVLVHLFRPEVRAFYNLEKMWSASRPNEARPG